MATVTISGKHARVGSGSDYWGKMHDPFDPAFSASVRNSLGWVVPQVKRDPWCLGYFVDNELSWGGFGDEGGRYGLGLGALDLAAASSPAKRAFLERLKDEVRRDFPAQRRLGYDASRLAGTRGPVEAESAAHRPGPRD